MFNTYSEAQEYIQIKINEYGNENKFYSSEEYEEAYPFILEAHDKAKEAITHVAIEAMTEVGVNFSDIVYYDIVDYWGNVTEVKGKLINKKGVPYVQLNQKLPNGKKSMKWHTGFRKEV